MGLTHYWRRPISLDENKFAEASRDLASLLGKFSSDLAGPNGENSPIIRPGQIAFNGVSPRKCESFEILALEFDRHGRKEIRSFCKTEGLPYDQAVRVALIVLKHHFPKELDVSSDAVAGWDEAKTLVLDKLNYGNDFELA